MDSKDNTGDWNSGFFDAHKLNEKGFAEVKAFKSALNDFVGLALAQMPDGRREHGEVCHVPHGSKTTRY